MCNMRSSAELAALPPSALITHEAGELLLTAPAPHDYAEPAFAVNRFQQPRVGLLELQHAHHRALFARLGANRQNLIYL